jgi:hypothetical protein
MSGWLETGILIAILAVGPAIALVFELRARVLGRNYGPPTALAEPCWTEDRGSDGRRGLARAECVNDALMEMDARAARGDFPIPRHYGG